eukprot:TRINITY_DN21390_c0_g1_i1.p1 TRINITY_DN21390_c0_g1~~TRINITY_DN21390_c0_g1_i1.p1  ORF type:complete len:117 (-),score=42.48 TRINITY_DN21390_c0_g1_i1:47-397(-)
MSESGLYSDESENDDSENYDDDDDSSYDYTGEDNSNSDDEDDYEYSDQYSDDEKAPDYEPVVHKGEAGPQDWEAGSRGEESQLRTLESRRRPAVWDFVFVFSLSIAAIVVTCYYVF